MNRKLAVVGVLLVASLGGLAVLVARTVKSAWWLGWSGPGKEGAAQDVPVPPDLLDRLAAGREHVEIVIGGRLLAQITGCG